MRVALHSTTSGRVPLHRQIYEEWRQGILNGRFRRGERVPSTRELALTLAVARTTVTAAYDQLIAEGYLDSVRGSGTFVCRELPDELLRAAPRARSRATAADTPIRLSRYGAGLPDARCRLRAAPRRLAELLRVAPGPERISLRHLAQTDGPPSARARTRTLLRLRRYLDRIRHRCAKRSPPTSARSRAVRCTPDQVLIVNGSQQALDLCARLLLDPGDEVAFENPGYQGARQVFAACGARLAPAHSRCRRPRRRRAQRTRAPGLLHAFAPVPHRRFHVA